MYYQCRVLNITELDDVLRYVYIDGFGDLVWVKVVETSLDLTQRQDVRVHNSMYMYNYTINKHVYVHVRYNVVVVVD